MPSDLITRRVVMRYSWLRQAQILMPRKASDTISSTSETICTPPSMEPRSLEVAQIRTASTRMAPITNSQVWPSTASQC
jgi:hypothetical protein